MVVVVVVVVVVMAMAVMMAILVVSVVKVLVIVVLVMMVVISLSCVVTRTHRDTRAHSMACLFLRQKLPFTPLGDRQHATFAHGKQISTKRGK
jgi:hypothetical protein